MKLRLFNLTTAGFLQVFFNLLFFIKGNKHSIQKFKLTDYQKETVFYNLYGRLYVEFSCINKY